ncbi:MAG: hypothetical protein OH338_05540 [Candidatus Parvarchaeota archaeon]|nr:hypothetical protein [Candidatus Parvarchaeum tengchongense]
MSDEEIYEENTQKPIKPKGKVYPQPVTNPVAISEAIRQGVPMPEPQISQETRDKLTKLMQDLLLKTHELSFEYSTLECNDIQNCPLACKSKELFKTVKELNKLMKEVTPEPKT